MVVPSSSLQAAGPLALPLFSPAAVVVFGAAVMDMVPPIFTAITNIIGFFFCSAPSVLVVVVAAGLMRHRGWVSGSVSLVCQAGFMVVVPVIAIVGLNNQWSVKVSLHVGTNVEGRRYAQALL